MANSIQTIDNKISPFSQVTLKRNERDYWIVDSQINHESNSADYFAKSNIKIITPEEARKTNNPVLIGLSIAGATVFTAGSLLFLLKGGGAKNLAKKFKEMQSFVEQKIQLSKLEGKQINRIYPYLAKILQDAGRRAEAVNNFTSFKDLLFKKLMSIIPFGGGVHKAVSRLFEKVGRRAVVNVYKDTGAKFKLTSDIVDEMATKVMKGDSYEVIEINGVRHTCAEWLAEVGKLNKEIGKSYEEHFSEMPVRSRYYKFKHIIKGLQQSFASLKVFVSKNVYSQFMAEAKIAKERAAVKSAVGGFRKELSYSVKDMSKVSDESIMKLLSLISYKDTGKIKALGEIRANISKYVKDASENAPLKDKVLLDIEAFMAEINKSVANNTMDSDVARKALQEAANLRTTISDFKQGKVEEVLDIYRKILSKEDFATLEKSYKESVKSLDKAINTETEDFLSKLRDLSLGSAPTDILSLVGGLSVLGYHLGKSDNNDERISISLKYGIPAIALIGVSLYCNAKLFAGSKALVVGTAASAILNRIGAFADDMLKSRKKGSNAPENTTKTV